MDKIFITKDINVYVASKVSDSGIKLTEIRSSKQTDIMDYIINSYNKATICCVGLSGRLIEAFKSSYDEMVVDLNDGQIFLRNYNK